MIVFFCFGNPSDKLDKKAENDRLERRKLEQRERREEFDKLSRFVCFSNIRFLVKFVFFKFQIEKTIIS